MSTTEATEPKPVKKGPKPLVYNATIAERIDMTEKLAIFRVRPDQPEGAPADAPAIPSFIGGQYVILGANNQKVVEKGPVRRAYSIASSPHERRWYDFYIRYVDQPASNNPLTHLLWDMQNGDRLFCDPKIYGKFTLSHTVGDNDTRLKVFVAAGTGLAPFVSIAFDHIHHEGPQAARKFAILHGARTPDELGYVEELRQKMNDGQTRYFPTVSRPHLAPDWKGDTGRVETFFDDSKLENLERRMGFEPGHLTPRTAVVYICGLQGTIGETIMRLLKRGYIPENKRIVKTVQLPENAPYSLFFEQYDTDPVIDLKNEELMKTLHDSFPFSMYGEDGKLR